MATLDERIAQLEEALATGARRVVTRSAGQTQETEFHSMKEMRDYLAALKAEKAGQTPGRSRMILLDR